MASGREDCGDSVAVSPGCFSAAIAKRTSSATLRAPSLPITLALCTSTVRGLMPSARDFLGMQTFAGEL